MTSDSDGEFDMLLLEFDTAVNLTSLKLNWAVGGNASSTADLSILAWNGTGSAALAGNTWSSILDSNGGRYDSVGNYNNVGLSYYTVNPTSIESTKWLVGVYNPVYGSGGDAGDDGFKLTSLKTSTSSTPPPGPAPVPVPGTAALILAGLLALRTRRSLKVRAK
jgi:MYXO-CTERM domain-containing protein